MRKLAKTLLLITVLLLSYQKQTSASENITICGTGNSMELLQLLGNKFTEDHPDIMITLPDNIGSRSGIRAVVMERCDFGSVTRPLLKNEVAYNLSSHIFAWTPVVFVTHPDMEAPRNLSKKDIINIFSGTTKKWEELGGSKGNIYLVNTEKQSGIRKALGKFLPEFNKLTTVPNSLRFSAQETMQAVRQHKQTIGYLPLTTALTSILNIMEVDDVFPTPTSTQSGHYTPVLPLTLVWKGLLTDTMKTFLDFLNSSTVQQLITQHGAFTGMEL